MKRCVSHRLMQWLVLSACFLSVLCLPLAVQTSPAPSDSGHHCVILDEPQFDGNADAASKAAAQTKEGPRRTVRLFYFRPNDRPYRHEVEDSIKVLIKQLQSFYGEQMAAHGYGNMTFEYETDGDGEPLVHRIAGDHADPVYKNNTVHPVLYEVQRMHSPRGTIQIIVVDHSVEGWLSLNGTPIGGGGGISGPPKSGYVILPNEYSFGTAVHELAHAFGMNWHDFRDDSYVLSYGSMERLSACSAAFLTVSPYFNSEVPLEYGSDPTIDVLSPLRYPAGSKSVPIRLKVADADGLHQLFLNVWSYKGYGSFTVKACRVLSGETETVVEFEYDGKTGPTSEAMVSDRPSHNIRITAIDRNGENGTANFDIAEQSPYHLATIEGHTDYTPAFAISPDGSTLASGSWDKTVKLWDTKTREEIATLGRIENEGSITSVAFHPDGSLLAVGTIAGNVALWDVESRTISRMSQGHTSWVTTLVFSSDGRTLVSGSLYDEDRIKVWDVASRKLGGVLKGHTAGAQQVAFSPDGSVLASCSLDKTIRVWDQTALQELYRLVRIKGGGIRSIAFSPNGKVLAADGSDERKVVLWDVAARRNLADLDMVHNSWINHLTFSPDGESLATAGAGGTVIVRDVATGRVYQKFGHTGAVVSLDYWHDGSVLAAATTDGKVELWDTSEWVRRRPDRLEVVSGLEQQGVAGTSLPAPFVVSVRDQNGDPFPGMPIIFNVTGGGGVLSATAARTDTAGNASTTLTLGLAAGMNTVTACAAGLSPPVFSATAWGSPDVNADGQVDFEDFVVFAQGFGTSRGDAGYDSRYDLDGDGTVGFSDFVIFAGAFGLET